MHSSTACFADLMEVTADYPVLGRDAIKSYAGGMLSPIFSLTARYVKSSVKKGYIKFSYILDHLFI
jgi:hypothetical protein